jgi:hypothetical protein
MLHNNKNFYRIRHVYAMLCFEDATAENTFEHEMRVVENRTWRDITCIAEYKKDRVHPGTKIKYSLISNRCNGVFLYFSLQCC